MRRDRARPWSDRGVHGWPPFSPFVSQSRSVRRRTPGLRVAFTVLFLLVVVGGAVAVAASSTNTIPLAAGSVKSPPPAGPPTGSAIPRRVAQGVPTPSQTVDRVLAYAPFVRGGIPRRRVIALTFDDGPSPYTPQVVRVLARMHVTATFFVVGQQLEYFSAGLRDELRHGFAVGDHTQNHPPLNALPARLQYLQIQEETARAARLGAPFPRLFRPPYGVYNRQTFAILRRLHMLMVLWSVDPRDWLRPGTKAIVQRVLVAARPGAIVELHDGGGNRSETVAALPAIITALRRRHYELVTVPELLAVDPPPHHQRLPRLSE